MSKVNQLARETIESYQAHWEYTKERLGRLTDIFHHLSELQKDKYNFDPNSRMMLNKIKSQIDNLCRVDEQTLDSIEMELGKD